MEIMDAFEPQLKAAEPLTEENFDEEGFEANYTSGREKEVGDIVLFAWMVDYDEKTESNSLSVISIHPDELSDYDIDYSTSVGGPVMPTVKKVGISE